MKTKKLIELLQKADPTGELECCVGNCDIHFVDTEPAYYDGSLQVLVRDETKKGYNIVGAKFVDEGSKVNIFTLSIDSAIFDNENLPVEYIGSSPQRRERYEKYIQENRQKTNEICNKVEQDFFVRYMQDRLFQESEEFSKEEVTVAAIEFYQNNMSYMDEMPNDIKLAKSKEMINGKEYEIGPSWNDHRKMQWNREIVVDFIDGKLILKRKEK